jgi:hypothetical protein
MGPTALLPLRRKLCYGFLSVWLHTKLLLPAEEIFLVATTAEHLWNPPNLLFFPHAATAPSGPGPLHYRGFTITHFRHTTLGRTHLDEGPASRRDLYLTTHNTHKRQTSVPPAGFEPAVPASERPKIHASDSAATGIGTQPPIWWLFGLRRQELEDCQILMASGVMRERKSLPTLAGLAFFVAPTRC